MAAGGAQQRINPSDTLAGSGRTAIPQRAVHCVKTGKSEYVYTINNLLLCTDSRGIALILDGHAWERSR